VAPGGAVAGGAAADGFTGGAVNGAVGGVSDAGAAKGVAVAGAANGVAVAGAANGVAVTGAAGDEMALLGCEAGPGANGGVAVEGMGMAGGLAAARGSCEVMTLALPGGAATVVPSVVGTSATCCFATCCFATCCFAASRLRAAVACTLLGLNGSGSVGFLT
jgi:hypothetical protein